MRTIKKEKVIDAFLSERRLKRMQIFAMQKHGWQFYVIADPYNRCYNEFDYCVGYCIHIGKGFYPYVFNDYEDIPEVNLKEQYTHIASALYGAYYHEFFHSMFTPFQYASRVTYRLNSSQRYFCHSISNILEDLSIENQGCYRFPAAKPFLDTLTESFLLPDHTKILSNAITNEPNNADTFISYMVRYCRGVDMSQYPAYQLWEDNKLFIEKGIKMCVGNFDPHARINMQIRFALQLLKILTGEKPDENELNSSDAPSEESLEHANDNNGVGTNSFTRKINKLLDQLTDVSTEGPTNNQPEDLKSPDKELTQSQASLSQGSDQEMCPSDVDLTREGITMIANDDPSISETHVVVRLEDFFNAKQYAPSYMNTYTRYHEYITRLLGLIRKMLAYNRGNWKHYKMTGKLDMQTLYKKDNYKIFKQKIAPKQQAQLVCANVIDGSGSMHGSKAKIAGEAAIIISEALDKLLIPFANYAFTEAGTAKTIILKDFDDLYQNVKCNMTLFTEQPRISKLSTWSCNLDELTLKYVASELAVRPERDKVIIMISDGATCGSKSVLKKIAKRIEAQGIHIFAVGIFDHNVEDIYSHYTVLEKQEDLERLPDILSRFLIERIFK